MRHRNHHRLSVCDAVEEDPQTSSPDTSRLHKQRGYNKGSCRQPSRHVRALVHQDWESVQEVERYTITARMRPAVLDTCCRRRRRRRRRRDLAQQDKRPDAAMLPAERHPRFAGYHAITTARQLTAAAQSSACHFLSQHLMSFLFETRARGLDISSSVINQ
jgi:hypothetical protein